MITQKQICLKIDYTILEELDTEAFISTKKRNWIINRAILAYLKLQDKRRILRCYKDDKTKSEVINGWLRDFAPEAATW